MSKFLLWVAILIIRPGDTKLSFATQYVTLNPLILASLHIVPN